MFSCLRSQEIFVAPPRGSKNVFEFVRKHFASSANVSFFAHRGNISGNNVSATMFPHLRAPLRKGGKLISRLSFNNNYYCATLLGC